MDDTGKALLHLMFDPGESICVSNSQFAYHSLPLEKVMGGELELISPNEKVSLQCVNSNDLTLVAINPINGFRQDSNVYKYRSFLYEIDTGSLKEQWGYLKHMGIPTSALVFSGNKSIHALVTLDELISNEKTYRYLYDWSLRILTMCDRQVKTPSKCIRIPGAYREPGKKQRLIEIKSRISHKEFFDWLNKYDHLRPRAKERKIVPTGHADFSRLSPWARAMLTKGITFNNRGRNQTWFGLAYDLALAGYTEEQGIEILLPRFQEEHNFKEKELLTTISSAFKKVLENQ